jgi:2-keto-4-pentenoate hydratase
MLRLVTPDLDRSIARSILTAHETGLLLDAADFPIPEEDAYRVQALVLSDRLARGETRAGWKLGYTSEAMRRQMGIASPNVGMLTDRMILDDGATLPDAVGQPRVEPEIALILRDDVLEALEPGSLRAHVASAHMALEVVDSVWLDYRFSWAQNTADGSSAAFVVIGPALDTTDLASIDVILERNGECQGSGRGADAMGDPLVALEWLSAYLLARGEALRGGDIVITGGLTAAVPVLPGDVVRGVFGDGAVSVRRLPTSETRPDGESVRA